MQEPEEEDIQSPSDREMSQPPAQRRRQSHDNTSPPSDRSDDEGHHAPSNVDVMVKKMVRLALSSEFARLPIRRTEISTKVLGEQGSRQFKLVFDEAQKVLRSRFGMQMVELPAKEKVTISQRRGTVFPFPPPFFWENRSQSACMGFWADDLSIHFQPRNALKNRLQLASLGQ